LVRKKGENHSYFAVGRGKGKIQAASAAKVLGDGKVGDREFLDKEKRNGSVTITK
jgi:hypothetical protein